MCACASTVIEINSGADMQGTTQAKDPTASIHERVYHTVAALLPDT